MEVSIRGLAGKSYRIEGPSTDSIIQCLDRTQGLYEHHITRLMRAILEPESVVLDIGANIGVSSVLMADIANKGQMYSFEPGKEAFSLLDQNIKKNNLAEIVSPLCKGVSHSAS